MSPSCPPIIILIIIIIIIIIIVIIIIFIIIIIIIIIMLGSSAWLTVLPLQDLGFNLNKREFRDAVNDATTGPWKISPWTSKMIRREEDWPLTKILWRKFRT